MIACCAGTLVLEELEHAQARGAPILAEFRGGSFTCDAHHMTEPLPDGSGVRLCIERCARAAPLFVSPAIGSTLAMLEATSCER